VTACLLHRDFTPFALGVIHGDKKAVLDKLKHTDIGSEERRKRLERRETGFRMSPLLALIAFSKYPATIQQRTRYSAANCASQKHLSIQ